MCRCRLAGLPLKPGREGCVPGLSLGLGDGHLLSVSSYGLSSMSESKFPLFNKNTSFIGSGPILMTSVKALSPNILRCWGLGLGGGGVVTGAHELTASAL